MTSSQRIIKNLAITFGIFLAVVIISSVISGLYFIINTFNTNNNNIEKEISTLWEQKEDNVTSLDIDINYSNITIKTGNKFLLETNNKNIKYKYSNENLKIEEKKYNLLNTKNTSEVIITIPSNLKLNDVDIDNGAGTLNIENINTKKLNLNLAAGITIIENIISDKTDIDSGAGKFIIKSGNINNLNFDIGVGTTEITTRITGTSEINTGVGKLELNLIGSIDDYKIKVNKGIGNVEINNKTAVDGEIVGTGSNYIDIDGGIGKVNVIFKENR